MTQFADHEVIPAPRVIAKDLIRLADWYAEHRPSVKRILLARVAWQRLRTADPRTLRRYEIERSDDGLTYKGFTLRCKGGGGERTVQEQPEA